VARAGADPLLDGYTREQRLFLGWARIWRQNLTDAEARLRLRIDPHAPAWLRVNAAAASRVEFLAAFGCEPCAASSAATGGLTLW
jgi:putative endopeptidase